MLECLCKQRVPGETCPRGGGQGGSVDYKWLGNSGALAMTVLLASDQAREGSGATPQKGLVS